MINSKNEREKLREQALLALEEAQNKAEAASMAYKEACMTAESIHEIYLNCIKASDAKRKEYYAYI